MFLLPFGAVGLYTLIESEHPVQKELSGLQISVRDGDGELRVGVTDFLTGVLAGQISAEYEPETLKAQAVIARTCLYERAGDRLYIDAAETGLDWRSEHERRAVWGVHYSAYNEKMQQAVRETDGMVLRYEDKLIVPSFFAISNGRTRSSAEAWGQDIPWLQSVSSEWDRSAAEYETAVVMTKRQMIADLKQALPDFKCAADSLASTYEVTETDSAGYVLQLQIGNKLLRGDDFRYALGLLSSCFSLDFEGNSVLITVKGSGHGVGFDQYGANRQALEGKNCEELLQYYFTGVKVDE